MPIQYAYKLSKSSEIFGSDSLSSDSRKALNILMAFVRHLDLVAKSFLSIAPFASAIAVNAPSNIIKTILWGSEDKTPLSTFTLL